MYTVNNDTRIFMVAQPVYRDGHFEGSEKTRVFENEKELIRHLACYTETYGYADPVRWVNHLIPNLFFKGGKHSRFMPDVDVWPPRCFTYRGDRANYLFYDAYGRMLNAHDYRYDVIAAVRNRDNRKTACCMYRKWRFQGRKRHRGRTYGRYPANGKARTGAYLRYFARSEEWCDDEGNLLFQWTPRKNIVMTGRCLSDWDYFEFGAIRSRGWEDHKCRHQWEHNVREQEKHRSNRERKMLRRVDYPPV